MAVTEVSICNHALALLGEKRILTLLDNNRNAGLCKDLYAPTRDAMIDENTWQFARKQARLIAEAQPPEFYYSHKFPLPPDCANITWVGTGQDSLIQNNQWERVGDRVFVLILTSDQNFVFIWYSARIEDAQQFPPAFADVLATRLAAEMAYPLTESAQRHQQLWQVYQNKLVAALGAEGQQGRTRRTFNQTLTGSVRGGSSPYFVTGNQW